jgi:type I restriction enzyme M protein
MDDAYAAKKQKELEAQRLLDSIDDYLLGELGIELPEPEENTIKNRIFMRNLSEVSGDRFDANSYQKERLTAINIVKNSVFPVKMLREIVIFRSSKVSVIDKDVIYVGMENIESNTGNLLNTDLKESVSSASIFFKNDILFPKLRPYLNKVYYADKNGVCSTEFHVLYSKSESNEFIANFLRSKIVVAQTKYLMSGNTLPRLQFEDIQKLFVPIPPLEKQIEISEHITAIRNQAKQLQQQAKDDLEKAKQEVEAMILGDD